MKKIEYSVKALLVGACIFGASSLATAQNVGINASGATPDASAALDVSSSDKGMLVPRVTLTGTNDATTITSPATSLLVYNTATVSDVTPGFYYYNGTLWVRMGAGTGSDDQNISGSGLSGTTLTIGIENGTNETVDLSSLQDGTGTDDQNISGSGLSGNTLTIGIEGGTSETVDLSSLKDHDWYEVGGTNSPDNINDTIYTMGRVGIGTNNPTQELEVSKSSGASVAHVRVLGSGATDRAIIGVKRDSKLWDFGVNSENANTNDLYIREDGQPHVTVLEGGNVGIGTTSPSAKLDVEGTFQLVDGTEGAGKVLTSDASGNASWGDLPGSISVSGTFLQSLNTNITATPWWNLASINIPSAGTWLISVNARLVHPVFNTSQNAWHMAFVNTNSAPSSTNLLSLESVMGVQSSSADYGDFSRHVSITVTGPTTIYCKANTNGTTQVHDLGVSYGYGVNANYIYARKLSN